jgi:hypothetical protein
MSGSREPRPLPALRPENAAASARILLDAGLPVSVLRGALAEPHVAQVEAALTALTAEGGAA